MSSTGNAKMSAYDGVPGFTKADLKNFVEKFRRERAADLRKRKNVDDALFVRHKGTMYESEKEIFL